MALTKVKAGNILLTTPSASSNDVTPATTQYVTTALANLADSAPATLNTLNELAAALGDDANFSTTVTNSIATKLPLAGGTMTGDLILGDGIKLEIGSLSGGDLQIYHSGTNSVIDNNTGGLYLRNNVASDVGGDIFIQAKSGENSATFTHDGAVTLMYDNAAKLATESGGVGITGDITSTGNLLLDVDNAEINLKSGVGGTSGAINWTYNTTGTDYASIKLPYDTRASTGLHIDSGYPITIDSASGTGIKFDVTGANRATITGTGLTVVGTITSTNLTIADGVQEFDKPSVKGFRFLHNDAGNDLSIQQGDTNNANYVTKFNISTDGYVGIGTPPAGVLHVDGHTSSVGTILEGNGGGDTVPLFFRVKANNNNVTNHGIFGSAGSTGPDNYLTMGPSSTNGVIVDNAGRVGIQTTTTNPGNAVLNINGGIRFNHFSGGHGLNCVSLQGFNNSSVANACGSVYYKMFILSIYHNNGHSQSLFLANGGGGVGFAFTTINSGDTTIRNGPVDFNLTTIGSSPNTFRIQVSYGGGALTVSRTSGTGSFNVAVHVLAGG